MLENNVRHIEDGMRPYEAALKGSAEIAFTIISISVSLVAAFIPLLLLGGIIGRLFSRVCGDHHHVHRRVGLRGSNVDADDGFAFLARREGDETQPLP
jgi:hypothetical protein